MSDCWAYASQTNQSVVPFPCNTVVGSASPRTGEVEFSNYGYLVEVWPTYLFLALNALGIVCFVVQGIYWRQWWTIATLAMGCVTETIGWAGRVITINSTEWNPNNGGFWESEYTGFIMQVTCLVIGPTFFAACNYALLGKLIQTRGQRYSSATAKSVIIIFIVVDLVCLTVQGVGGGMAGSSNTLAEANRGAYIMTGGVCVQLVATLLFLILYAEFLYRYTTHRPATRHVNLVGWFSRFSCCGPRRKESPASTSDTRTVNDKTDVENASSVTSGPAHVYGRTYVVVIALGLASLLIVIRGVFRSVELTNGWAGPIATNEPLFLALDPLLMGILIVIYMIAHPGLALGRG